MNKQKEFTPLNVMVLIVFSAVFWIVPVVTFYVVGVPYQESLSITEYMVFLGTTSLAILQTLAALIRLPILLRLASASWALISLGILGLAIVELSNSLPSLIRDGVGLDNVIIVVIIGVLFPLALFGVALLNWRIARQRSSRHSADDTIDSYHRDAEDTP